MTLTDLIDRLEKAEGPDRELDLAIHVALYPDGEIARLVKEHRRGLDHKPGMAWDIWHSGSVVFERRTEDGRCPYNGGIPLPAVTSSLDAALTLVPEGSVWAVMRHENGRFYADVGNSMQRDGASAPLALTAASLDNIAEQQPSTRATA